MDRTIAPKVKVSEDFNYVKVKSEQLDNDIPLYYIDQPEMDVIKLECIFKGGMSTQKKPLLAKAVAELLKEGTATYSSEQIAAQIEAKGAFLDTTAKADYLSITLYALADQLIHLLPTLRSIITEASFPEEELQDFIDNGKQKFAVNNEKVSFLAKNEFMQQLFGENHPYNDKLALEDFDSINRADLQDYYADYIQNKSFSVMLSGKVGEDEKYILNQHFGSLDLTTSKSEGMDFKPLENPNKRVKVEKKGASQAALRLGKLSIGKQHEDFPALFFLNTLFGGFFGSRLMTNIREEKGYTYGIGSGLMSLNEAAYFFISSEIGANYVEEPLAEIQKEMQRLSEELITEEELNLVKRYLQGSLMRSFDGPFSAMDRYKSLYLLGLDYNYYDHLWSEFSRMTAEKLQTTAKKYMRFDDLSIIIAGA